MYTAVKLNGSVKIVNILNYMCANILKLYMFKILI